MPSLRGVLGAPRCRRGSRRGSRRLEGGGARSQAEVSDPRKGLQCAGHGGWGQVPTSRGFCPDPAPTFPPSDFKFLPSCGVAARRAGRTPGPSTRHRHGEVALGRDDVPMAVGQGQAVPRVLLGAGLRGLADRGRVALWGELQGRQGGVQGGPMGRHGTDGEALKGRAGEVRGLPRLGGSHPCPGQGLPRSAPILKGQAKVSPLRISQGGTSCAPGPLQVARAGQSQSELASRPPCFRSHPRMQV